MAGNNEVRVKASMGRPKLFTSAIEMQRVIEKYFRTQDDKKRPYTITGLAKTLGMTRKTLLEYQKQEKFSYVVEGAKTIIEEQVEELLLTGKNAAGCQFWLKNQGWSDKSELEVSDLSKLSKEELMSFVTGILGVSAIQPTQAKRQAGVVKKLKG